MRSLGKDLLFKSGFKIEFVNSTVKIVDLKNESFAKETHNHFNKILCIDHGEDELSECKNLLNIIPDLELVIRNKFVKILIMNICQEQT